MEVPVPDGVTQYGVESGSHGTVTYSHHTVELQGWRVQLSVG